MIKLILAVIIIAMGIAGRFDYEEEQRQAEQYCEMVQLWKRTGGRAGWPAYDGEEACRDTQCKCDECTHSMRHDHILGDDKRRMECGHKRSMERSQ